MIRKVLLAMVILIAVTAYNAYAASQTMNASVSFMSPLSIGSVTDPSFGKLSAGVASTVYKLDTSGNITTVSGPGEALGGSPVAGSMRISGSSSQTINISTGNLVDDNNITPSNITCAYNGGSEVSCDDSSLNAAAAPGSGKELKVGLTITTLGNEADGDTASPSFTINVVYN